MQAKGSGYGKAILLYLIVFVVIAAGLGFTGRLVDLVADKIQPWSFKQLFIPFLAFVGGLGFYFLLLSRRK